MLQFMRYNCSMQANNTQQNNSKQNACMCCAVCYNASKRNTTAHNVANKLMEFQMTPVEIISSALEQLGTSDTLVTGYSGRGMYGDTCVGVNCTDNSPLEICAAAIKLARRSLDESQFDEFVDTIMDFKTDSLGRRTIIYWECIVE